VLHGATGGYTGMFVLVLAGTVGLGLSGLLVTRNRYVDDELHRPAPAPAGPATTDVVEVAGAEPPVTVHLREPGGGSPRG
jgi:CP family cyanate transporter-like MFS transporter